VFILKYIYVCINFTYPLRGPRVPPWGTRTPRWKPMVYTLQGYRTWEEEDTFCLKGPYQICSKCCPHFEGFWSWHCCFNWGFRCFLLFSSRMLKCDLSSITADSSSLMMLSCVHSTNSPLQPCSVTSPGATRRAEWKQQWHKVRTAVNYCNFMHCLCNAALASKHPADQMLVHTISGFDLGPSKSVRHTGLCRPAACLNVKINSTFCPHSVSVCSVWLSQ
jgi:hypothetical protein